MRWPRTLASAISPNASLSAKDGTGSTESVPEHSRELHRRPNEPKPSRLRNRDRGVGIPQLLRRGDGAPPIAGGGAKLWKSVDPGEHVLVMYQWIPMIPSAVSVHRSLSLAPSLAPKPASYLMLPRNSPFIVEKTMLLPATLFKHSSSHYPARNRKQETRPWKPKK